MYIRETTLSDLPTLATIFREAREFMRSYGNGSQWGTTNPSDEKIVGDIGRHVSFVCIDEQGESGLHPQDGIVGTFAYFYGDNPDVNYDTIRDGAWPDNLPYGVVHRIATLRGSHGVGQFCLDWAYEQSGHHLRIDTHRDNVPMQNLLRKCGFLYCGIIRLTDGNGTDRDAFIKV